tara:strand:- start:4105 stop:4449 length:345 start_codon:yes stop_codon:yes gene_type:complete
MASTEISDFEKIDNKLSSAPPLSCPRKEFEYGDDISESSDPPGWNELTQAEKLDILDWEMDCYWDEIVEPINWWQYLCYFLLMSNFMYLIFGVSDTKTNECHTLPKLPSVTIGR